MVWWWSVWLGCAPAEDPEAVGVLVDETTPSTSTDIGTNDTETSGATGDTAATLVDTDTVDSGGTGTTETVEPIDCATYVPQATLAKVSTSQHYPAYFSPRDDGQFWYYGGSFGLGTNGVYLGTDLTSGTRIYEDKVEALREDQGGTLHVVIDDGLYRSVNEGPLTTVAGTLSIGTASHTDPTVHPSGTVTLATKSLSPNTEHLVSTVLADGTLHQWEVPDLGLALVKAVAYDADRSHLWLIDQGLFSVEVDADGVPDWSTLAEESLPPSLLPLISGAHLAVDACDGVWLMADFGFGSGRLYRYDPVSGTVFEVPGNVDQGYGSSGLRFGRVAGTEHVLATLAGGWNSDVEWYFWDVGIGVAPW